MIKIYINFYVCNIVQSTILINKKSKLNLA